MATTYPLNYELQNDSSTKHLNVVVEFEGSDVKFALLPTYKRVRWGDPDLTWGMPDLLWGGLVPINNIKAILSPNTQLIVDQKIEPEQGRASAATLNLEFIDINGFMTEFVTPGKYLNEVLGGKVVKVYLGYQNTGFKDDYFVIFRGYVSMITVTPTKIMLQLTDANLKRRQQIFKLGKTQVRQFFNLFTFTDVNFSSNYITLPAHKFENGNRVQFFTGGSLPLGLTAGADYYIVNKATNTIQLATAPGGGVISLLSSGSGTSSIYLYGIGPYAQIIPVVDAADFVQPVIGPDLTYDSTLKTYIKIGNEIMSYTPTGLGTDTITVLRAQRNTTAEDHDATGQTAVDNIVELEGNLIDLSLKLMLSGWGGTWISSLPVYSFVNTGDPELGNIATALTLPGGVDAIEDYGLSPGDYIYVSGSTIPGNNGQRIVSGFLDLAGYANNVILCDVGFVYETLPTSATFSIRSQYDTYPLECGSKLKPIDVDVASWQRAKRQFLSAPIDTFRIFVSKPQSGKEFIESQMLLPAGAYSVTRFGRLSVALTKPPLAGENLVVINHDNVIEPQNIVVKRGLNNRRFFNEVQYFYDFDDSGESTTKVIRLDSESLSAFDTSSVLPIQAQGLRTDLGAAQFVAKRIDFIIKRYKDAATEITLKTNWKAASLIEVSDIVALYDNGELQITNLETGERDMGNVLLEVIQRQIDIKSGTGTLTLLGQTGYQISDRFGGIAPSSETDVGSSTMEIVIKDSFQSRYPFNEKKKWEPIIGERIRIHSRDYSFDEIRVLTGFQPGSSYRMLIDSPLPSSPPSGYVVDCDEYPDNSNVSDQVKSKLLFSFLDPTLSVVSGISATQFTVSPTDANNIFVGLPIKIHNDNYSINSSEAIVDNITGVTVTLSTSLGFTPSAGQKIELIGFRDLNGPYRLL